MRHLYECPMRWADLDQLGHVNNVVYVDYLQEARVDMLRAHRGAEGERGSTPGPAAATDRLVEGVVVVRHEVTYLAPLEFDFRPVLIECWVTEIRAASFTMAYEVFHPADPNDPTRREGRTVYARASTVLSPYVFTEERPRRLTAEERGTLREHLEPAEREARPATTPRHTRVGHYPVQVRFSDVDVYGHVNNVKYFEYFQEARVLLTARLWREVPLAERGSIVVAQTDVDYRAPILFRPEAYDAWTWISHVGTRSMVMESEIRDGDRLLSRARVVVVFFDLATGRSTEPSPAIRAPLLTLLPD